MTKSNFTYLSDQGVRMRVHGADDLVDTDTERRFMRHGEVFHVVPRGTVVRYFEVTEDLHPIQAR